MKDRPRQILASDTTAWEHCPRHAWFLFHPPAGGAVEPEPFELLIQSMGDAYEASVLEQFPDAVEAQSVADTQRLIAKRTPVIYQPQFADESRGVFGLSLIHI